MKCYVLIRIFILLTVSSNVFSQSIDLREYPQKKDNYIVIYFYDSLDIALDKISHALALYEFTIRDIDPYKKTFLTTYAYPFTNENFRMGIVGNFGDVENHEKIKSVITLIGFVEHYFDLGSPLFNKTATYYCAFKEGGTHIRTSGFRIMKTIAEHHGDVIKYSFLPDLKDIR
jgi:hypothetical protein